MARPKTPGRGADQFPLRLPDGMRDEIKAEAFKNGQRSMNQEIVERLQQSLALPPLQIPDDLIERMRNAHQETRKLRGQMMVRDLVDYFPPMPPKRVIRITTQNMIDSLERSLGKSPEVAALVTQVRQKIEAGEIDGDGPAEIALPPVDWNQALRGQSIHTGPLSALARPEIPAGIGEIEETTSAEPADSEKPKSGRKARLDDI